ncbi:MAG: hypothetical protein GY926_14530 [bacterium]|nr:hypothetical protein [bacterium]MCP4966436.1 hypothetical protein [bacterium]
MNAAVGPGTMESATDRSPAEIYEVVDDVRLHRLQPAGTDVYPVPIVLVPSLLSKWYVFDLHPARTMAGFLRDHQYDVWVVDWGKPRCSVPATSGSWQATRLGMCCGQLSPPGWQRVPENRSE